MKPLVIIGISLLLFGCTTAPKPYTHALSFDEAEWAPYRAPGTATVSGQAFLVQNGGTVVKAAGREVWLWPKTKYSDESFQHAVLLQQVATNPSDQPKEYCRTCVADGDGNFTFSNVPAGKYYVITWITWQVPYSAYSMSTQGGYVADQITVAPGDTKHVILSHLVSRAAPFK